MTSLSAPAAQAAAPQQARNKPKLLVYTIEECPACGQKTKRSFQQGDYITRDGASCSKCNNTTRITLIYAEPPVKPK